MSDNRFQPGRHPLSERVETGKQPVAPAEPPEPVAPTPEPEESLPPAVRALREKAQGG